MNNFLIFESKKKSREIKDSSHIADNKSLLFAASKIQSRSWADREKKEENKSQDTKISCLVKSFFLLKCQKELPFSLSGSYCFLRSSHKLMAV